MLAPDCFTLRSGPGTPQFSLRPASLMLNHPVEVGGDLVLTMHHKELIKRVVIIIIAESS